MSANPELTWSELAHPKVVPVLLVSLALAGAFAYMGGSYFASGNYLLSAVSAGVMLLWIVNLERADELARKHSDRPEVTA